MKGKHDKWIERALFLSFIVVGIVLLLPFDVVEKIISLEPSFENNPIVQGYRVLLVFFVIPTIVLGIIDFFGLLRKQFEAKVGWIRAIVYGFDIGAGIVFAGHLVAPFLQWISTVFN